MKELNVCWNNVIRRVFGYYKWETVSALLLSLERLYRRLFHSANAFIRNLFLSLLCSNHNEENMLKTVLVVGSQL